MFRKLDERERKRIEFTHHLSSSSIGSSDIYIFLKSKVTVTILVYASLFLEIHQNTHVYTLLAITSRKNYQNLNIDYYT